MTDRRLVDRYRETARRYAQITGEQPPVMEADPDRLRAAIAAMTTKMNGMRQSRTGKPVVGLGGVRLIIDADEVRAQVDGIDDDGAVATTVEVVLGERALFGKKVVDLERMARVKAAELLGVPPP